MSDPVKQVAMRILDLREISDYTVDKMAEVLNVPVEEYRKYESGEVDMPISFLVMIGEVFHVDMTELLTGEAPRLNVLSVTRAGRGQEETSCHDQYVYRNLAYNFVGRKIEPMYVVVAPEDNKTLTPNSHDGQEFDYILSGTMHIVIGKNDVVLHPGDSVYYDSRTPHAMEAVGGEADAQGALIAKETFGAFASAVAAAQTLRSTTRFSTVLSLLSGILGLCLCALLLYWGSAAAVSPFHIAAFQLIWALVAGFLSGILQRL